MDLIELGWNEFHRKNFDLAKTPTVFAARVAQAQREKYLLLSALGELKADIPGKLRFNATTAGDLPVVGDWVVAEARQGGEAMIVSVLPRRSKFSRKSAGNTMDEQVSVANIDTVFLVNGLDGDYNLRRIERYLALARVSNAKPVIVLNKTDVRLDFEVMAAEVRALAPDTPVIAISALNNEGFEQLKPYILPGSTIAFMGSSGAGKSSMINRLMGSQTQEVGAVREDDSRGRHITTRRELMLLPGGGIVIDNPGFRELQLWADEEAVDPTFADVMELASGCKYGDCTHTKEPGCAVIAALASGALDAKRYESYLKLKGEQNDMALRKAGKLQAQYTITEKQNGRKLKHLKSRQQ